MRNIRMIAILLSLLCCLMPLLPLSGHANGDAQIRGLVFLDAQMNGSYTQGAEPVPGAEIALIQTGGQEDRVLASTVSQEDGSYHFAALSPGDYYLQILLPDNLVPTLMKDQGSRGLPASGNSTTTLPFSLKAGDRIDDFYIGALSKRKTNYIKVIAFGDENANGGRFSSEPLLKDIEVILIYEANNHQYPIATRRTDKEGVALFRDVTPGSYRIAATLPEPYVIGPLGQKVNLFYNCLLPTEVDRGLSAPFEVGSRSVGLAIGAVRTGKAKGLLWYDANCNGKVDPEEKGYEKAALRLTHLESGLERDIFIDKDGSFHLDRLHEGRYTLSLTLPEDAMFTLPGNSLMCDALKTSDTISFDVRMDETTTIGQIGIMPLTSLSLRAFHDENVDGMLTPGEQAFSGAQVEVVDGSGALLQASTNAEGVAHFPRLRGGDIKIRCTAPGQVFSIGAEGGNLFSSITASSDLSIDYTLPHGSHAEVLAGITLPAIIEGTVFDDENLNGVHDPEEGFITSMKVEALNSAGEVAARAVTNEDGVYQLENLVPDTYTVKFYLTPPYIFSDLSETGTSMENKVAEQTPSHGLTLPVKLTPGQTLSHLDAGVFASAIINGKILLGDESDHFAGKAGGLANASVRLLDEAGAPVNEYTIAKSEDDGSFSLKGAIPGTYLIEVKLPKGSAFSKPYLQKNIYISKPLTVRSNDVVDLAPLFAVKTGEVKGQIFQSTAKGESCPIANAQIQMTDKNGRLFIGESNAKGEYQISGIRPGDYQFQLTLPKGMIVATDPKDLIPPSLTNVSSSPIHIGMGEKLDGKDLRASTAAELTLSLFYDNDLNDLFDDKDAPSQGTFLTLQHQQTGLLFELATDTEGKCVVPTLPLGKYVFELPLPDDHIVLSPESKEDNGRWIGSFVLAQEKNAASIALAQYGSITGTLWNLDGSDEETVQKTVHLFNAQNHQKIASTTTDQSGTFSFKRLLPGSYQLKTVVNEGFRFARTLDARARTSLITADPTLADEKEGLSTAIILNMGEHKVQQDIGIGALGKLGDTAWLDLDNDGMQDTGEPGVPGIVIRLYQYGELVAETTTDVYGHYLFKDLYAGEYTVEVTMPPELKTTRQQTAFPLVASILPESEETTVRVSGIIVPGNNRNLNCDFGFTLRTPGKYPEVMRSIPQKDWTPLVSHTPTR